VIYVIVNAIMVNMYLMFCRVNVNIVIIVIDALRTEIMKNIQGNVVIGLVGRNASGKGQVAEYLKSKGFIYYSLSDVIRNEASRQIGRAHV